MHLDRLLRSLPISRIILVLAHRCPVSQSHCDLIGAHIKSSNDHVPICDNTDCFQIGEEWQQRVAQSEDDCVALDSDNYIHRPRPVHQKGANIPIITRTMRNNSCDNHNARGR